MRLNTKTQHFCRKSPCMVTTPAVLLHNFLQAKSSYQARVDGVIRSFCSGLGALHQADATWKQEKFTLRISRSGAITNISSQIICAIRDTPWIHLEEGICLAI